MKTYMFLFVTLLSSVAMAAQDQAIEKAKKTLEMTPDDPAANLVMGKYHLALGNVDTASSFLLKGSDASLKAAVKAEGVVEGSKALIALEAGDLWTQAMSKNKTLHQACLDRASYWYAKAWDDLDDLHKMKLRERLTKIYAPAAPTRSTKLPEGWAGPRLAVGATRVHSGGGALRVAMNKDGAGNLVDLGAYEVLIPKGKTFEFSVWVCSEDTNGLGDKLQVEIRNGQKKALWLQQYFIGPDKPVWVKLGDKGDLPEGVVTIRVGVLADSTKGVLYADDISLKIDGKEVLKGGTFE